MSQIEDGKNHSRNAVMRITDPLHATGSSDAEEGNNNRLRNISSLALMRADYGYLGEDHPAQKLVYSRLRSLLPDVPEEELPTVHILGAKGEGVNAMAFQNWTILFTPELLEFVDSVEELDYVILHETAHLTFCDHDNLQRNEIRSSITKSLGAMRHAEYRADTAAFCQMAESNRGSNPRGAISFLERLRATKSEKSWDAAHGHITDRILNLKEITAFLELDRSSQNPFGHILSQPLQPIDPSIRDSLAGISSEGGSLGRLLQTPPYHAREWGSWIKQVRSILQTADTELIAAALPTLYKKIEAIAKLCQKQESGSQGRANGISTSQDRLDSYLMIFDELLYRWSAMIEAIMHDQPADKVTIAKTLLLETSVNIPMLSMAEVHKPDGVSKLGCQLIFARNEFDQKDKLMTRKKDIKGSTDEIDQQNTRIRFRLEELRQLILSLEEAISSYNRHEVGKYIYQKSGMLRTIAEEQQKVMSRGANEIPAMVHQVIRKLTFPIEHASMTRTVREFMKSAVGANAVYDNEEGIVDYQSYFSDAATLINAAEEYESQYAFATAEDRYQSLDNTWPDIIVACMHTLADIGQLDEQFAAFVKSFQEEQNQTSGANITFSSTDAKRALIALCTKTEKNVDNLQRYIDVQWRKNVESMDSAISELASIQKAITNLEAADSDNDVFSPAQAVRMREVLASLPRIVEASNVNNQSPLVSIGYESKEFVGMDSRSRFVSKYLLYSLKKLPRVDVQGNPVRGRKESILRLIRIAKSLAEHQDFLIDMSNEIPGADFSLTEMEYIREELCNQETHDSEFGWRYPPAALVDLSVDDRWSERSFFALEKECENITDPEVLFSIIDRYLAYWPVLGVYRNDETGISYTDEFISAALGFIKTDNPSKAVLNQRLLALSFFCADVSILKRVQEICSRELLEDSTFEEAMQIVFYKYSPQGFAGGIGTLKILEQKVKTPEQMEALLEALKQTFSKELNDMKRIGQFVLAEGATTLMTKRKSYLLPLQAIIATRTDESQLQRILGDSWSAIFSDDAVASINSALAQSTGWKSLENEIKKTPLMLTEDGKPDVPHFSCDNLRNSVYRLGVMEKSVLLRKLLSDEGRGVLTKPRERQELLEEFLELSVITHNQEEEKIAAIVKVVFESIVKNAPSDELALILTPILRARMAAPPRDKKDWGDEAKRLLEKLVKRIIFPYWSHTDAKDRRVLEVLRPFMLWMIEGKSSGRPTRLSAEELLAEQIPPDLTSEREEKQSPLSFVVEIAQNFGAPGVRFLQLLGQVIQLPDNLKREFSSVYDNVEGQTKLSGWETVKNVVPEYAASVRELGDRKGGGSLFTVYEAFLQDGTKEAARILNPNAWYHAELFIKVIRQSLQELAKKNKEYAKTLPLVDIIEEWIRSELTDQTFEEDDHAFRASWNGWKPADEFQKHIVVPESKPTGSSKVQRDEFIEGTNLTSLHEFPEGERKELVALAVQHYMGQVIGSLSEEHTLVHSDISAGNLRRTTDGNLAILDRGMYLKFSMADKLFLADVAQANNIKDRSQKFLKWLLAMPENSEAGKSIDAQSVVSEVERVSASRGTDVEESAIDALMVMRSYGLYVPLRFTLLFKNLNALRQLSQDAGFASLQDALAYDPSSR
ncbi:MAG: AarF/UbiB family protein [Candidatus Peribacteraceae bacterium]